MQGLTAIQAGFITSLRHAHCHRYVETLFLYHAAPVLRGAKPAALITLRPPCVEAWRKRRNALLRATGLQTKEIATRRGAVLLLMYDEPALCVRLRDERTVSLLAEYGYPAGCDPGEALACLQARFTDQGFPHEVGIFLGYPAEDVWGFIVNEGRNCVCCRYWKVYHNAEQAQETFRRMDEAYRAAMELLAEAAPIHIVAKRLKTA
ncbi:MAG: DUF3793 family protein [Clostridium sp.]|jgi:hypothetical protein|nr:DUF3793 family protein [Clostridium sp.]